MFEEMIEACKEIEELKIRYKLNAIDVCVLQILKASEIEKQTYSSMKEYLIEKSLKSEHNQDKSIRKV